MNVFPYDVVLLAVGYFCGFVLLYVWPEKPELTEDDIRKALTDLYYRRAKRVEEALAGKTLTDPVKIEEKYVFSGWIELLDGGMVAISDQELDAKSQTFQVDAIDSNQIVRATATSNGQGTVAISSHGLHYFARWNGKTWVVEPSDPNKPPSLP